MAKCFQCLRVLVIIFNVLFVLFGLVYILLGCSAIFYKYSNHFIKSSESSGFIFIAIYVIIGLGSASVIIGSVGILAMRSLYAAAHAISFFLLAVIFASDLAVCSGLWLNSDKVKDAFGQTMDNLQRSYPDNANTKFMMDIFHTKLQCCGSNSFQDFNNEGSTSKVPWSCCDVTKFSAESCTPKKLYSLPPELAYRSGCKDKGYDLAWRTIFIAVITVMSLSCLKFLTMMLTVLLCCCYNKRLPDYAGVSTTGDTETVL